MRQLPQSAVFCFALAARALADGCLPAEHDPITARDLAAALPAFARLAPDTPVATAPGPGVRRVFRSIELISFARNHALPLDTAPDLCFELLMETLERDRVLEAMLAALPFPETRIEIVETSLYRVPRGRLEFRREDLGAPALPDSQVPVTWRGNVVYGANQRFAVWAHVLITARLTRLVAVEAIRRGSTVTGNQIRLETYRGFPNLGDTATSIDQVAGRMATRVIDAGATIRLSHVDRPLDVKRGDTVEVQVKSGAAHLALTGKSESDGRIGDTIAIRNLHSNKIFQARVDGKDKAFVEAAVFQGN